ncbi:FadR/GntR family transcriptional regulator [Mucilaginibacter sp. X4EP1]|uniref:FadR/GntR family transcriptional regulator n=1 Tax=Mucilaginibacter sp. X4EP1 TaxID=2723092 RepID=UPI0021695E80|nr:GntR family transcriptional regulator [Mucilaginibacter sp. X4EP1]MCS3812385.1 DNA-binding FadR family transcriptional regulator [Mucilaginibacter sp. X4EP1]
MKNLIIKKSLAEEIAYRLREQISSGYYKINEKLPTEPELMESFGVGRSTIREAVKSLVQSGFLRVQQGAGTFVEKTTADSEPMDERLKRASAQDLDEVRQLLEMKIAEKAAINRSGVDIIAIKRHLADRKTTADNNLIEECIEADIQFHVAIAEAAKNEIIADLYRSMAIHLKKWFLTIYPDTAIFKETQYLHEQLLKDIIACDSKKAWNTAAKIIGRVYQ